MTQEQFDSLASILNILDKLKVIKDGWKCFRWGDHDSIKVFIEYYN